MGFATGITQSASGGGINIAENGLNLEGKTIRLGGQLDRYTQIELGNETLRLNVNPDYSGGPSGGIFFHKDGFNINLIEGNRSITHVANQYTGFLFRAQESLSNSDCTMDLSSVGAKFSRNYGEDMSGAIVSIGAGGTGPGTAPLKLKAGSLLDNTEVGAVEYDGNSLYFTKNNAIRDLILFSKNTITVNQSDDYEGYDLSVNGKSNLGFGMLPDWEDIGYHFTFSTASESGSNFAFAKLQSTEDDSFFQVKSEKIAFFNQTIPATKQTVSGATTDDKLNSLLSALNSYGLINV